ncbi:hypothetical protein MKW98_028628 [Papaver atlanticum]|uniref:Uncharacterized protein n=1 Tax=Papaver atlanticum TaxID=357466 RepID=A0AAD4RW56_9MAGN|nr:hypothetical protein MKW98_028628 [Papaver atlanticum]
MARHRGGHVKQVSRGDPMTTSQYSSSPPTQERAPANMRYVDAMGGTSLNVSKSRKRPAAAVTTPQRPLKRRQSVIDTALQVVSPQRPQSLIQAKRSLLLGDVEKRQSSVPLHNDVEGNSSQHSFENRIRERSTSASHPTSVHRNSPRVSPQRHTQSPLRHTLLARDTCESTPRRSPRFSRRQQTQLADNEDISPKLSRRGFLQEASNSPLETDSAYPPAKKITKGITTHPKVSIRDTDKDKLKVEVFEKSLVGTFSLECILAIGMWVRQSDNFPLTVHLFRNMPEEKITRVSKLVRDYYILVPDDENTEEAIRTQMRLAHVRYRSELAAHYRSFDSHEEALRHPSPRIRNVDDWAIMCDFFNTDIKFKIYKFTARAARKAHDLNHSNGTESFARKAYDRVHKNLPIDPLSMFMVTHNARKLGKLCKDWQLLAFTTCMIAEMNQLSEQVRRGEVNYIPEEIYAMVVDPRCIGAKRARKSKVATRFSLYEKNEAQMAALQEQLDSEKKKVAKQDKEISKIQRRERNLRENLNEVLKTHGCDPVLDDIEDESLDEREHEVDDGFTWDDLQEDENDYDEDDDDLQVDGFADGNDDNQEKELSGEDE